MNYELLGKHIRERRKEKKYTLEQLAEKLNVSVTFIGQIERAKGIPSLETLVKIANVLEVSIDGLMFVDLSAKSGNSYFIEKVMELTESFSSDDKELVIKQIELIKEFKNNAK